MTKGRKFFPSTKEHGIWYRHVGMPEQMESRINGTTTGVMLRCNPADNTSHVKCPPIFQERMKQLGKHKSNGEMNQHTSDDFISWGRRNLPEYQKDMFSLYQENYTGIDIEKALEHRRYWKQYPQPTSGITKLSSNTTMWVPKDEEVLLPYLQTLANAQAPYLKPNPWRYSFRSHSFAVDGHKRTRRKTY